jgi:hypothetical protein
MSNSLEKLSCVGCPEGSDAKYKYRLRLPVKLKSGVFT